MKFTREEFNEFSKNGFFIDDFPISSNQTIMLELFNNLPTYHQGLAIQWGTSDSVFRDNVFKLLCEKILNMTCKEYYDSKIAKDYFDNGELIENIDFTKLNNN